MRGREFLEKLGFVDPKLVEEAGRRPRRARRRLWLGAAAAVLVLAFTASALLWPRGSGETPDPMGGVEAVALAAYPEMAPYPDENAFAGEDGAFDSDGFMEVFRAWRESQQAQLEQGADYAGSLSDFYAAALPVFLTGEEGENRVFSPLNVYFALGMLAELTDGESRGQRIPPRPGRRPLERQLLRRRGHRHHPGLLPVAPGGGTLYPGDFRHPGGDLLRLHLPGGPGQRGGE